MNTKLHSKNLPFIPDSYLIDNTLKGNKPYRARNVLSNNIYSASVIAQETPPAQAPQQEIPAEQPPSPESPPEQGLPLGDEPAAPAPPGTLPEEEPEEVGYISVGVFTASGALPVEDAVVTVYILDDEGDENVISHLVTDANGQIPTIQLPVYYDSYNPLESSKYFFSTYNLRVQAINYYTVNILDFRVFPDTTTNFTIEMIPVAAGPTGAGPDTTYVVPPSPIDISNE